jgi:hypothetical protein
LIRDPIPLVNDRFQVANRPKLALAHSDVDGQDGRSEKRGEHNIQNALNFRVGETSKGKTQVGYHAAYQHRGS